MTETRDDSVTWMSQEAYDRLKAELDHLSGPGRIDIAKKIEAARDEGDLKENGGYHAAKDEQGQIEARIVVLQHILENARVGGPPRTDGVVHLSGPGRAEIAKKIEAARAEGDLNENGGYHAAKDEQGQIEARIIVLQHILENARVGGPPRTDGVVGPGMTVTIRFVKDDEEVTFLLASREESGSPIDVYSPRSPLGAAISGKKVGEKATYSLPNGRASTVEILEAVPYVGA